MINPLRKVQAIITGKYLSYRYDQRAKLNTTPIVNEFTGESIKADSAVVSTFKVVVTLLAIRYTINRIRRFIASVKHNVIMATIPLRVKVTYRLRIMRYHVLNWTRFIRLFIARLIVAVYIVYLMSALFPVNPEAQYS